jgi:multidrug efflux pump subunit AcrA (membrane-fusion protein)
MKGFARIVMMLWLVCLAACSRTPTIKDGHLEKVEAHVYAKTSYYSGTIQPLKTYVITSPADGVIVEMPFQYGEEIKPGQLLFQISSAKFMADYKTALMAYVKAKSEFNNGQTQLNEATFLHKHELISDDEFKMKQSNFYAAQLGLLQAKDALQSLIHQLDIKDASLYNLTIADVDKITQAMHHQSGDESLRVVTPVAGVALAPNKSEDENKKVFKGDIVKQGDVLAVMGDLSGLSVRIKVNELTINQLSVGQKVKVTGIAFPDHVLNGMVDRVDRQGEASNNGLPTFSVQVIVPKLTPEQQKQIHVGMSAKIEITTDEDPHMLIPIKALREKDGVSFVQTYNEQSRKFETVAVRTGKTTVDAVEILSGLSSGDNIVVPD